MVYAGPGSAALNRELIDTNIKGFAEPLFVLKSRVTNVSFPTRELSYYRQSATLLTAQSNLAPGAEFPVAAPIWELNTAYMKKHGLAQDISHEDIITNKVDTWAATQKKIAEAVVASVEKAIAHCLDSSAGLTSAATYWWDVSVRANRHPVDDIALAFDHLSRYYYKGKELVAHPQVVRKLMLNDDFKSSLQPQPKQMQVGESFMVGWLPNPGVEVISCPFLPTDQAVIANLKKAITWNDVEPFKTSVEDVPGEYKRIKAWNLGMAYCTDPQAIFKVTNVEE